MAVTRAFQRAWTYRNLADRLLGVTQSINLNPTFAFLGVTDNSATSDYHALQLNFQRRLSQRLQALASYSFSHSIDSASTDALAKTLYIVSPSFHNVPMVFPLLQVI